MKKASSVLLSILLAAASLSGCSNEKTLLHPQDPVVLTMWHVYGEQADSPMNRLVSTFNETTGLEKGVVIDVTAISNSSRIGEKLLDSQAGTPGEPDMPDLFFCHPTNAAALGASELLDWNEHFTEEELSHYVPEFLDEGVVDDRLVVFPVSKSTYLLFVNGTQFERFSADTGVSYQDLSTWEGFLDVSAKYYEWSGGKPFCAMDYMIRAAELSALSKGHTITLNEKGWYSADDDPFKEEWLAFARSMVQGHIAISDLYANTQVMTGEVASGLGSSAAILYYNDMVTYPDNTTEPMNLRVLPMPQAEGGISVITQAGVGLCARETTDQKAEAASVFAHWLTEGSRNLDFVATTGYMPVSRDAFDKIGSYNFTDDTYAQLYETMKEAQENSTSVIEHTHPDYFTHVHTFYDQIRSIQPDLLRRVQQGADPDTLALETWDLLCSIS